MFTLSILRSLLPVYNSLMAFKQFLFRSLPGELEQLGTVARWAVIGQLATILVSDWSR